ncbi:hypothetical protein SCHPADRAFT_1001188 [Schizopora paradoxa]|uniref:F-box domain-containing protein n=1 Tax=Schizopora paradoxa TaxID=27342 RepID=A0A0H2RTD5_9AGAM|nr:hypothetical protein SCHPADRAFT_1001188 [Schizopora paradoxa]
MDSSRKMAAACLPRTNGLPLNIRLIIYDHDFTNERSFDPILAELLPVTERWGRLQLKFIFAGAVERRCDFDGLIEPLLRLLDAPLLDELYIDYSDFVSEESPPWDWSRWNTPNLRHLKTISYFPFFLPGLSSVTSLDLTIDVCDGQMSHTLEEISQMGNLRDLTLKLSNAERPIHFAARKLLVIPQVRHLKIETAFNIRIKDRSRRIERSIFSFLFFPNLVHLRLDLEGTDYYHELKKANLDEEHTSRFYFKEEINRIFSYINQFPKVESLYFNIITPFGDLHNSKVRAEVAIPLNMLPSLKDFTLQSNTRFDIVEPDDPDDIFPDEEQAVAPRVVGNAFPILDSVTLDMFDISVVAKWLGDYLEKIKYRGKWDEFRELAIMERVGLDLRKSSYPGDEALKWCEDKMIRYVALVLWDSSHFLTADLTSLSYIQND